MVAQPGRVQRVDALGEQHAFVVRYGSSPRARVWATMPDDVGWSSGSPP
jgi:hypothetical protein